MGKYVVNYAGTAFTVEGQSLTAVLGRFDEGPTTILTTESGEVAFRSGPGIPVYVTAKKAPGKLHAF